RGRDAAPVAAAQGPVPDRPRRHRAVGQCRGERGPGRPREIPISGGDHGRGAGTEELTTRSLARLALRQVALHPWQLALAILGIALGVAVAASIDLANASALRAFGLATEAVSGRATHQILGGPSGLPD